MSPGRGMGEWRRRFCAKWDDIQYIAGVDSTRPGIDQGERRQIRATCEAICFTVDQTLSVMEMLRDAEADNDAIGPKIAVLEHRRKDLQQQCKGVDGAMAERERLLREEELSCENMRRCRQSLMAHFESIWKGDGSEDFDAIRDVEIVAEEGDELRILDKDLEFGVHILNRESTRTEQL